MKRIVATLLLPVFLLTGCGTTAKFVYPSKGTDLVSFDQGPAYDKKVAVVPFEEMRGDKNSSGTYFLYMIPLMPFGWGRYERPDAARMFNTVAEFQFNPSEDLAKAAAYSLRKSNLFKDAFFTYGGDKENADLLLEGEIISTEYRGSIWSYGLSFYGPLLWFFGFPAGRSHNELGLSLKMKKISDGSLVWKKSYTKNSKVLQGLYYNSGHDVKGYSYLMQEVMNEAINDMNRELARKGMR